jgi:5-methylcytosine-specific restriction protein A
MAYKLESVDMAVTKGHGNPKWTREEVILALELYHQVGDSIPGPKDERVIALSEELRSFPYHGKAARKPSFRNPDGVAFKLQNIRQLDTGRGLSNTSKVDREIWDFFGSDPAATIVAAARIRNGIEIERVKPDYSDDDEFPEGRAVTQAHRIIERNRNLRKQVIRNRTQKNKLSCDICGDSGNDIPEKLRESLFEVHHRVPISARGETKTRPSDVALLCANCHRLLHRVIANTKRWVDIPDAHDEIFRKNA